MQKLLKHHPKTLKDFKKIKLELIPLSRGAYRTAYRIKGSNVVVKIPVSDDSSNLVHAREEIKAINQIKRFKRKNAKIIKMLPEIYYFDDKSGVTAMKYYKKIRGNLAYTVSGLVEDIIELIYPKDTYVGGMDIHGSNVHVDENGNTIIIDLGYFTEAVRNGGEW